MIARAHTPCQCPLPTGETTKKPLNIQLPRSRSPLLLSPRRSGSSLPRGSAEKGSDGASSPSGEADNGRLRSPSPSPGGPFRRRGSAEKAKEGKGGKGKEGRGDVSPGSQSPSKGKAQASSSSGGSAAPTGLGIYADSSASSSSSLTASTASSATVTTTSTSTSAAGAPQLSAMSSGTALSEQYELLEKLGTGSFGTVYKGVHKATGQIVAIKQIDLEDSDDDIGEIQQEIAHLAQCDSEYVTRYYGSFVKGYKLWIIMEYLAGGSCLDLLKAGPFAESHIAVVCRELLLGLEYLHAEGKIHRDIKAANVLLSATGKVKLADFGVAAQLSTNKSRRNTFVGTPFWMAPEVIRQAGYDAKADLWSLGITAIELAKGEPPLSEYHPMRVLFLIPKAKSPSLEGGAFSQAFKDFVDLCLLKDPKLRPTTRELLQHRFIRAARKTAHLTELIERHTQYKARRAHRGGQIARDRLHNDAPGHVLGGGPGAGAGVGGFDAATGDESSTLNGSVISSWQFDTLRSNRSSYFAAAAPGPAAAAQQVAGQDHRDADDDDELDEDEAEEQAEADRELAAWKASVRAASASAADSAAASSDEAASPANSGHQETDRGYATVRGPNNPVRALAGAVQQQQSQMQSEQRASAMSGLVAPTPRPGNNASGVNALLLRASSSKESIQSTLTARTSSSTLGGSGSGSGSGRASASTPATSVSGTPSPGERKGGYLESAVADSNGSHAQALRDSFRAKRSANLAPPTTTSGEGEEEAEGEADGEKAPLDSNTATTKQRSTGSSSTRRSSWNERQNVATGTLLRAGDVASGHDTIRPVKRLDAGGSARLSTEYLRSGGGGGNLKKAPSNGQLAAPASGSPGPAAANGRRGSSGAWESSASFAGDEAKAGQALVADVVLPVLERARAPAKDKEELSAHEIEAIEMIARGFEDLSESNPKLAYQTIVDLLLSMNE